MLRASHLANIATRKLCATGAAQVIRLAGAGTRGRQTMLPEAHFRQVELAYAHCNKTQYEEALLIRIIFIRFPDPQATTFALKQT